MWEPSNRLGGLETSVRKLSSKLGSSGTEREKTRGGPGDQLAVSTSALGADDVADATASVAAATASVATVAAALAAAASRFPTTITEFASLAMPQTARSTAAT